MSTALEVVNLSKEYRIGAKQNQFNTLRDSVMDVATAPFRRLSSLMRGEAYGAAELSESLWALRDVSFTVQQGDVVGIIGRNGAGKSTLLKILSQITEPTHGQVRLYGRVGSLLEVGTGFHQELTGRENIYLNGAILGMSRADISRKFDEIVDFSGVEKFLDTPVKHYSSGMGLRLGFAVAAHMEPDILIVDEVLAVGDAEFQKKCLGKMSAVAGEGRTVLFVSHNLQAVRVLCKYGIWLEGGTVVQQGDVSSIVNNYLKGTESFDDPSALQIAPHKQAIISAVRVKSIEAPDWGIVQIDEPILAEFKILCQRPITNLSLGFSFHSESGQTMFVCYSGPGKDFDLTPGVHIIQAQFNQFSVTPGLYTVGARIEAHGIELDWPKGVLYQFEVISDRDLYGIRQECLINGQFFILPDWKEIPNQQVSHEASL